MTRFDDDLLNNNGNGDHNTEVGREGGELDEGEEDRGPLAPYIVQLLLERPAIVDRARLLDALRTRCGEVTPVDEEQSSFGYAFDEHHAEYPDGAGPVLAFVTPVDDFQADQESHLEPAIEQTWDWDEAGDAVHRCRAALVVNDLGALALDRKVRLELFQHLVAALIEQLPVVAIHWIPAQRIVDPRSFLAGLDEKLLSSAPINVRLFKVEDGQEGEQVMDTRGMEAFGLPDLQCHFAGLDPSRIAALLFGCADYLFEQGDVIEDQHTVQGLETGERWLCHHELSLVEPRRTVLDIHPGKHRPASA